MSAASEACQQLTANELVLLASCGASLLLVGQASFPTIQLTLTLFNLAYTTQPSVFNLPAIASYRICSYEAIGTAVEKL